MYACMESQDLYCPLHKEKLVLRVAKQGKQAGNKFYGCPTWSKTGCNYTLPYKSPPPTTKEIFLSKIKNKNGKINPLKVIGYILLFPIYILVMTMKLVFPIRKNIR